MTIQERIKCLRIEHNPPLTQAQLGKILHMSQRAISRLETGEAHLQDNDIKAYCEFFGVSADYILGITNKNK